jgi:NADPH2 dehydrogenase
MEIKLDTPIQLKQIQVKNRLVMAPMCMYQSDDTGFVMPFHEAHYYMHALGGIGLVMVEATAVSKNGRISEKDLGIWSDEHVKGLKIIANRIQDAGSIACIQLNHAGRKSVGSHLLAPSEITMDGKDEKPKAMTLEDIEHVIMSFKKAAMRADQAGFDMVEIHAAHGYLISQFMSPLSNLRNDKYGLKFQFLNDVIQAVMEVWPEDKAISIRISGTEYHEEGFHIDDVIHILQACDLSRIDIIHVSSGGNVRPNITKFEPGYQLSLAHKIKHQLKIKTIGGGLLGDHRIGEKALLNEDCDMVFYGRLLLRDPFYFLRHIESLEFPVPYQRGKITI